MSRTSLWRTAALLMVLAMVVSACGGAAPPTEPPAEPPTEPPAAPPVEPPAEPEPFIFGMLLVGPYNDRGWSQAHYEAGEYVVENLPGAEMIYLDRVNPADRPGTTPDQLAEQLMAQGATAIIFNSDDMKDASTEFARNHPEIAVIMASGDQAWTEGEAYIELPNLGNIMGEMEYGKMIGGCAAALTTQTGQIGYLGPLINDETRRLAASAYLGARYCWTEVLGNDPAELEFRVTWIGFWFHIPGVTSDPTQVANDFYNSGFDVVISGIDTTEALVEAARQTAAGTPVRAVSYDYIGGCEEANEACLGVPFFNWGPAYLENLGEIAAGTWTPRFELNGPDWSDINNPDTSAIGFVKGGALSAEASAEIDAFIAALAGGLELFVGPLNFQDGTPFLADGEVATEHQIWYMPQLLEGMQGQSVPQ